MKINQVAGYLLKFGNRHYLLAGFLAKKTDLVVSPLQLPSNMGPALRALVQPGFHREYH
jgi:hypothetical protein